MAQSIPTPTPPSPPPLPLGISCLLISKLWQMPHSGDGLCVQMPHGGSSERVQMAHLWSKNWKQIAHKLMYFYRICYSSNHFLAAKTAIFHIPCTFFFMSTLIWKWKLLRLFILFYLVAPFVLFLSFIYFCLGLWYRASLSSCGLSQSSIEGFRSKKGTRHFG